MNRNTQITLRDGLEVYFQEIQRVPLLSRSEEKKLAFRWYQDKDREAARLLVLSNLRFVVKIARQYTRYGLKLSDLIQEGNLGLLHAVQRFDPQRGFRLISYAVWWIRAYIQSYILRSWSLVRIGTTRLQRRIFSSLQKARQRIAALTAGEPVENKQLAEALDVSEVDLTNTMQRIQQRDLSIDAPLSKNSDATFSETMVDDSPSAESQMIAEQTRTNVREKLDGVYEELTPRERYLLNHRLLSDAPVTLESAGREFGVTRERVRQIEERLKKKLRTAFGPELSPSPAV